MEPEVLVYVPPSVEAFDRVARERGRDWANRAVTVAWGCRLPFRLTVRLMAAGERDMRTFGRRWM